MRERSHPFPAMPADACAAPSYPSASGTAVYQPRRPERTVVYQVVQRHLETGLEQTRARDPERSRLSTASVWR